MLIIYCKLRDNVNYILLLFNFFLTPFKLFEFGLRDKNSDVKCIFNLFLIGIILQDCIVCEGASLEAGCDLSNCIVGRQHTVSAQSNLENQILLDSDRMMHV